MSAEGVEPSTYGLRGQAESLSPPHTATQARAITTSGRRPTLTPTLPGAPSTTGRVAPVWPQSTGVRLRVLDGGVRNLLSVRQVAERLSVSTATVYRLAERGELPHLRLSNAVRVAPADLEAFIDRRKRGDR